MSPDALAISRPTPLVLAGTAAAGARLLSPAERERMARLRRSGDREDFLAAHLLIRECAGRLLGVDPVDVSIVQRCATCGGPHGRPEVVGHPGVGASLAHSRGVVAAAAGRVPLGIDVEAYPPAGEPAAGDLAANDLAAVLTTAEVAAIESAPDSARAVLLAWARKEACLKAGLVDLDGLERYDLSALPLDRPEGDLALRPLPSGDWIVYDWEDGRSGAIGAVVAPGGAELTLAGG